MTSNWNFYRKKVMQKMRPYVPGESMTGISVSPEDIPGLGGMIACNPDNPKDQWYVAKDFFNKNYELMGKQAHTYLIERMGTDFVAGFWRYILNKIEQSPDQVTLIYYYFIIPVDQVEVSETDRLTVIKVSAVMEEM